jgi:general stress protein 26
MLWFIICCVVMCICYKLGRYRTGVEMMGIITLMEHHNVIDRKKWNQLCKDGVIPNYPYPE